MTVLVLVSTNHLAANVTVDLDKQGKVELTVLSLVLLPLRLIELNS